MGALDDARAVLAEVRDGLSRVAAVLVRLDTDPTVLLARDATDLRGRSAQAASAVTSGLAELWQRYPAVKDEVDALDAAVRDGDEEACRRAVARLPAAVEELDRTASEVAATADDLGGRWRDLVVRVDRVAAAVRRLTERAQELGLVGDPSVATAVRVADDLARRAVQDPLGTDPVPTEAAVDLADDRIDDLVRRRSLLPGEVADARALLAELEALVPEGRRALDEARAKVADPIGLVEPLDPSLLDRGDLALRPWLARLEGLVASSEWPAAASGIDNWRTTARAWLARARSVVDANRGPVEHRNRLRGLLEAYRAKATATGLAEDESLAKAYADARDALYARPCDVTAADRLAHHYGRLVNERAPSR